MDIYNSIKNYFLGDNQLEYNGMSIDTKRNIDKKTIENFIITRSLLLDEYIDNIDINILVELLIKHDSLGTLEENKHFYLMVYKYLDKKLNEQELFSLASIGNTSLFMFLYFIIKCKKVDKYIGCIEKINDERIVKYFIALFDNFPYLVTYKVIESSNIISDRILEYIKTKNENI